MCKLSASSYVISYKLLPVTISILFESIRQVRMSDEEFPGHECMKTSYMKNVEGEYSRKCYNKY